MYNIKVTRTACLRYAAFQPGLLTPLFASYQAILAYRGLSLWNLNKWIAGTYAAAVIACFAVQVFSIHGSGAVEFPGDPNAAVQCLMSEFYNLQPTR